MSCRRVLVSLVMVAACRSNDAAPSPGAMPMCDVPTFAFGDLAGLRAARDVVKACDATLAQFVAANPAAAENPDVAVEAERLRKLSAKIGLAILVKEREQSR